MRGQNSTRVTRLIPEKLTAPSRSHTASRIAMRLAFRDVLKLFGTNQQTGRKLNLLHDHFGSGEKADLKHGPEIPTLCIFWGVTVGDETVCVLAISRASLVTTSKRLCKRQADPDTIRSGSGCPDSRLFNAPIPKLTYGGFSFVSVPVILYSTGKVC